MMKTREDVSTEIAAIKGRLKYLNDDGMGSSAEYTRWALAQVVKHAGHALWLLSCKSYGRTDDPSQEAKPCEHCDGNDCDRHTRHGEMLDGGDQ